MCVSTALAPDDPGLAVGPTERALDLYAASYLAHRRSPLGTGLLPCLHVQVASAHSIIERTWCRWT